MGEILGLGITHYPPLSGLDENMADILKGRLADPAVPMHAKDPASWPEAMRQEWGMDQGATGAAQHRSNLLRGLRKARAALDDFNPDLVLIWGDDQYENFKESIIPPFCVLAYDEMELYPWRDAAESAMFSSTEDNWGGGKRNIWGEGRDYSLSFENVRDFGRYISSELLERDFDVAYAYEPLNHPGLPHAFLNSILYLDYDRKGFPWPVLPFQVNCYGRAVISQRGYVSSLGNDTLPADPPAPTPRRVFNLGAQVAKICKQSPWRVALIASSSWSHAFLNDATHRTQPDVAFDRMMYQHLTRGNLHAFQDIELSALENSGNSEMLNWCALAGAMNEIGSKLLWSEMVETYVFNSSKVTAIYEPK